MSHLLVRFTVKQRRLHRKTLERKLRLLLEAISVKPLSMAVENAPKPRRRPNGNGSTTP